MKIVGLILFIIYKNNFKRFVVVVDPLFFVSFFVSKLVRIALVFNWLIVFFNCLLLIVSKFSLLCIVSIFSDH